MNQGIQSSGRSDLSTVCTPIRSSYPDREDIRTPFCNRLCNTPARVGEADVPVPGYIPLRVSETQLTVRPRGRGRD